MGACLDEESEGVLGWTFLLFVLSISYLSTQLPVYHRDSRDVRICMYACSIIKDQGRDGNAGLYVC